MRLGVITDIHNNLTALRAVMERLNKLSCNRIICCGDIIGIGPFPEETVQAVMRIPNLTAVRGNHEKYLLEGMPAEFPNEERMEPEEVRHHRWEHSLLSAESVEFLRSLPYRTELDCEGIRISVMHYCMDRDGHYVRYTPSPSEDELKSMFAGVDGDIILYGHDHRRHICQGGKTYVNAGSLGCPAQEKHIARACLVSIENGRVSVQSIDVEYDVHEVIRAIDERNVPDAGNIKRFFYGIG